MSSSTCPKCSAPRAAGAACPRCGVIYAKAEARAAAAASAARLEVPEQPLSEMQFPAAAAMPDAWRDSGAPYASETEAWSGDRDEAALELKLRILAIPVALILARLLIATDLGRFFGRTFLSMWIHEAGHAVTAWFCGFRAVPLPWFTTISDERTFFMPVVLAAGIGYAAFWNWKGERRVFAAAVGSLLLVQAFCTFGLGLERARALVIFAGDGGCLLLGALLMATFYVGPESQIHQGWLRWGFLVIGAVSFMDAFEQWWASRTDSDRIMYGENEGVTLSDATKLTEIYGWTEPQMVRAFVGLGIACLVGLAVLYVWGLMQARRRVAA